MRKLAVFSAALFCTLGAARAHHAPAIFDQTRTIVVEGKVTDFVWSNPHSWIRMNVVGDDGELTNWSIEMNPPTYLIRGGWRSTTLKPGDEVSVVVNPLRTGEAAGKYVSITLPDGRVLGEQEAVLGE
jgi:hypothetical protein